MKSCVLVCAALFVVQLSGLCYARSIEDPLECKELSKESAEQVADYLDRTADDDKKRNPLSEEAKEEKPESTENDDEESSKEIRPVRSLDEFSENPSDSDLAEDTDNEAHKDNQEADAPLHEEEEADNHDLTEESNEDLHTNN